MKEYPMLFNAEMAAAFASGAKSETRRLNGLDEVNAAPDAWRGPVVCEVPKYVSPDLAKHAGQVGVIFGATPERWETPDTPLFKFVPSPFGGPGDVVWAREPWRVVGWHDGFPMLVEYRDGLQAEADSGWENWKLGVDNYAQWEERIWMQCAEDCDKNGMVLDLDEDIYKWPDNSDRLPPTRWRPSIHMPRWCARTVRTIRKLGVERLLDITPLGAAREGVAIRVSSTSGRGLIEIGGKYSPCNYLTNGVNSGRDELYRAEFLSLWDKLYASRGLGTEVNPLVWVYRFEDVMPEIGGDV